MHIRCPHCQNPIDVVDETPLKEVLCPSCGSTFSLLSGNATETFRARTRRLAHFELIKELGIGKFGSVWMARDTQLDRTVAIKIPRKGALDASEAELFLRDARAAAQLQHPNIVGVHEVGREHDTIYIVSDYVEGATLSEWLLVQHPSFRKAAELMVKVAEAVHHAHQSGVVHRDLKPSNIMMDGDGEPHVIDFGLAKREASEITMTVDGQILGTPAYMSPEQAGGKGHDADRRSDVYSLGVILYELLSGQLPFRGNTQMLVLQILNNEPPRPRKLNNGVPRDLETICLKAMAKRPEYRYQTAIEFADDLKRFLEGRFIKARPVTQAERIWHWSRRNPTLASLSVAVVVLMAVVGFLVGFQGQRQPMGDFSHSLAALGRPPTKEEVLNYVKRGTVRIDIEFASAGMYFDGSTHTQTTTTTSMGFLIDREGLVVTSVHRPPFFHNMTSASAVFADGTEADIEGVVTEVAGLSVLKLANGPKNAIVLDLQPRELPFLGDSIYLIGWSVPEVVRESKITTITQTDTELRQRRPFVAEEFVAASGTIRRVLQRGESRNLAASRVLFLETTSDIVAGGPFEFFFFAAVNRSGEIIGFYREHGGARAGKDRSALHARSLHSALAGLARPVKEEGLLYSFSRRPHYSSQASETEIPSYRSPAAPAPNIERELTSRRDQLEALSKKAARTVSSRLTAVERGTFHRLAEAYTYEEQNIEAFGKQHGGDWENELDQIMEQLEKAKRRLAGLTWSVQGHVIPANEGFSRRLKTATYGTMLFGTIKRVFGENTVHALLVEAAEIDQIVYVVLDDKPRDTIPALGAQCLVLGVGLGVQFREGTEEEGAAEIPAIASDFVVDAAFE